MTKKIWWSLPALVPIGLPVFSVISCSSQSTWASSEAGEFFFLPFKEALIEQASKTPPYAPNAAETLKSNLWQKFLYNKTTKMGLRNLDVRSEGMFFILDYELEVPVGSIWEYTNSNLSELPNSREILKGTVKALAQSNGV